MRSPALRCPVLARCPATPWRSAARAMVGVLAIGIASGCGAPPTSPARRPTARPDDAVELAALLPDRVDRCVVARPRRLAARQRSLVTAHSWAEPWAWDADLPVVAYATAEAEVASGGRARRTYVRLASGFDPAVVQAIPVRWLDEPCDGIQCRLPMARWIDRRTVEITRHEWPRRALPTSSADCVQLARRRSSAFEVAADAAPRRGPGGLPALRGAQRVVESHGRTLAFERTQVFASTFDATLQEAWIREHGLRVESAMMPLPPRLRRVSREGTRVVVTDVRAWEELELALEDDQLRRRALSIQQQRSEPTPVDAVDVSQMAAVRHQVRLRRAEIDRARGPQRRTAAAALARLLERAFAQHPSELALARESVRVSLTELADPAAALEVIARVLASGLVDEPEEWRVARREALSHGTGLADALVEDGIAPRREAARAAQDLAMLRAAGVPYEWAEGAYQVSRRLFDGPAPRHRVDAQLPLASAASALVAYAQVRGAEPALAVQLAVRAGGTGEARAIGHSTPELLLVRDGEDARVLVGAAAAGDLIALRRLGESLLGALSPGRVELVIELTDLSTQAAVRRMRVVGVVSAVGLTLERVSDDLVGTPWELVSRYLARPLAELATALFPPPELVVRAESEEMASALGAVAAAHLEMSEGACDVAGPILRCRAPGAPELLGPLLTRIASRRFAMPQNP